MVTTAPRNITLPEISNDTVITCLAQVQTVTKLKPNGYCMTCIDPKRPKACLPVGMLDKEAEQQTGEGMESTLARENTPQPNLSQPTSTAQQECWWQSNLVQMARCYQLLPLHHREHYCSPDSDLNKHTTGGISFSWKQNYHANHVLFVVAVNLIYRLCYDMAALLHGCITHIYIADLNLMSSLSVS